MARNAKTALVEKGCVSCGCCASSCPIGAISIYKGLYAVVSTNCVGCGRCETACPAGVIRMVPREVQAS